MSVPSRLREGLRDAERAAERVVPPVEVEEVETFWHPRLGRQVEAPRGYTLNLYRLVRWVLRNRPSHREREALEPLAAELRSLPPVQEALRRSRRAQEPEALRQEQEPEGPTGKAAPRTAAESDGGEAPHPSAVAPGQGSSPPSADGGEGPARSQTEGDATGIGQPDALPGGSGPYPAAGPDATRPTRLAVCDCGAPPGTSHSLGCWLGEELRRASYRRFAGPGLPPLAEPRAGLEVSRLVGVRIGGDGAVSFEGSTAAPADLDGLEGFGDAQAALAQARAAEARDRAMFATRRADRALQVERSVVGHDPSLGEGECLCPTCRKGQTRARAEAPVAPAEAPVVHLGRRRRQR